MPFVKTAVFPTRVSLVSDLYNVENRDASLTVPTLAAALTAGATSFTVSSGTGAQLPDDNFTVTIDNEIIFVSSRSTDSCTGLTRGIDGTSAAAHNAGTKVNAFIVAAHHNQMAAEINALEGTLGTRVARMLKTDWHGQSATSGGASSLWAEGGLAAGTASGTVADTSQPKTFNFSTDATTNDDASEITGSSTHGYIAAKPILLTAGLRFPETASQRRWFGLSSLFSSTGSLGTDTPSGHHVGFRYSTSVPDSTWVAVSKDGTTQGVSSTGVAVDTSYHIYSIYLDVANSLAEYYIDHALVATRTTNLPDSAQVLGAVLGVITLEDVAKTVRISHYTIMQDWF